ncbi:hypothetical protein PoB_006728500 [Plakobranchus ocellatus]|uniref:Uncharacterized protein n=1 Tax=Plakobranchus ocellatus TaxID=259542 RepID=A0AAV4D9I9_9GAST|nr:hypothetical protein PoB_006728500 [Plakobranchus ocellatus]
MWLPLQSLLGANTEQQRNCPNVQKQASEQQYPARRIFISQSWDCSRFSDSPVIHMIYYTSAPDSLRDTATRRDTTTLKLQCTAKGVFDPDDPERIDKEKRMETLTLKEIAKKHIYLVKAILLNSMPPQHQSGEGRISHILIQTGLAVRHHWSKTMSKILSFEDRRTQGVRCKSRASGGMANISCENGSKPASGPG